MRLQLRVDLVDHREGSTIVFEAGLLATAADCLLQVLPHACCSTSRREHGSFALLRAAEWPTAAPTAGCGRSCGCAVGSEDGGAGGCPPVPVPYAASSTRRLSAEPVPVRDGRRLPAEPAQPNGAAARQKPSNASLTLFVPLTSTRIVISGFASSRTRRGPTPGMSIASVQGAGGPRMRRRARSGGVLHLEAHAGPYASKMSVASVAGTLWNDSRKLAALPPLRDRDGAVCRVHRRRELDVAVLARRFTRTLSSSREYGSISMILPRRPSMRRISCSSDGTRRTA